MPEKRLYLESDRVYHIYTHANGNEKLFRSSGNYRYFLVKYGQYAYPVVETYAYCLMPNHLHLMIKVRPEDKLTGLKGFENLGGTDLSKAISRKFSHLFNGYTQAYNKMYDRRGSLFIPRFHRKLVDSDSYFTTLIAYIHNNPVNHGFVKHASDWPHSSWHSYLSDRPTRVERGEVLEWFGGKEVFVEVHRSLERKDIKLEFED
ncbi:transposase [Fulvivirga ligni]|uniref:transposase n=1 Tax=Fulvivirga ligni TaxID=2904246 RepID=UPI001F4082B8|nr:transposase [Fulvivirga ligni]UII20486.1 transposase [Fulvivirga ligni]